MNHTEKLLEKYPLHIIEYVRQNIGLEKDDASCDEEILSAPEREIFRRVVIWNGLLGGYDITIKDWVESIYGVDLDNLNIECEDGMRMVRPSTGKGKSLLMGETKWTENLNMQN